MDRKCAAFERCMGGKRLKRVEGADLRACSETLEEPAKSRGVWHRWGALCSVKGGERYQVKRGRMVGLSNRSKRPSLPPPSRPSVPTARV